MSNAIPGRCAVGGTETPDGFSRWCNGQRGRACRHGDRGTTDFPPIVAFGAILIGDPSCRAADWVRNPVCAGCVHPTERRAFAAAASRPLRHPSRRSTLLMCRSDLLADDGGAYRRPSRRKSGAKPRTGYPAALCRAGRALALPGRRCGPPDAEHGEDGQNRLAEHRAALPATGNPFRANQAALHPHKWALCPTEWQVML